MPEHFAVDAHPLEFGNFVRPDHAGLHQRSDRTGFADADQHEICPAREIKHGRDSQLRHQNGAVGRAVRIERHRHQIGFAVGPFGKEMNDVERACRELSRKPASSETNLTSEDGMAGR